MTGYAAAGTWLIAWAVILSAPTALTWAAVKVKRGRR